MPRRKKPTKEMQPWKPRPRLRSENLEDDDKPARAPEDHPEKQRSRPCSPCMKLGVKTPAHRILNSGVALCEQHYLDWAKAHGL